MDHTRSGLPQILIHLQQELGEIEVALAGFAGGFEVGAVPVAFFVGRRSSAQEAVPSG